MRDDEIVVFELTSRGDSKCDECGRELWKGNLLRKEGERGLCIDCAEYTPSAEAQAVLREYKEQHYAQWLNDAVPRSAVRHRVRPRARKSDASSSSAPE